MTLNVTNWSIWETQQWTCIWMGRARFSRVLTFVGCWSHVEDDIVYYGPVSTYCRICCDALSLKSIWYLQDDSELRPFLRIQLTTQRTTPSLYFPNLVEMKKTPLRILMAVFGVTEKWCKKWFDFKAATFAFYSGSFPHQNCSSTSTIPIFSFKLSSIGTIIL